jgi:hypothetical protein
MKYRHLLPLGVVLLAAVPYPPTLDEHVALRTCAKEMWAQFADVDRATTLTGGTLMVLANHLNGEADVKDRVRDDCMLAHGWARD